MLASRTSNDSDTSLSIRFGTFGGKTLTPVNIKGNATLQSKTPIPIIKAGKPVAQINVYQPPKTNIVRAIEKPSPVTRAVPVTTRDDSDLSHVTLHPVTLTPTANSRLNTSIIGNITGRTAPSNNIYTGQIQKIVPSFGVNPTGSGFLLDKYRNDSAIASYNSGSNVNSPKPAIDPSMGNVNPPNATNINPAVTQNQNLAARVTDNTSPNPNTALGDKTKTTGHTLMILGIVIIAAILLFRS